MGTTRHVAVVGLDEFNGRYLTEDLHDVADINFFAALERDETHIDDACYDFEAHLDRARDRMRSVKGGPDGIITYWDFPSSAMAPFLAREFDLPYPSAESVMKCEHKLWSREEQAKVVDTPDFCGFDPFADDPLSEITLDYPFWVKPVVGHSSMLGFEITNAGDFAAALDKFLGKIRELTRPFRYPLENCDLPAHHAAAGPRMCIAEEMLSAGDQFTVEGYIRDGEVHTIGIVESIRMENEHSFSHYRYPARLDDDVAERMRFMSEQIMRAFEFEGAPFNIEYFYDCERDRLDVLEVNSRMSQSHSDLFKNVDGQPHQQIAVDLALDREPRWHEREGEFPAAAKFFIRRFEDAFVQTVPSDEDMKLLKEAMPDVRVALNVEAGQRLSELSEQESYSYEIADLFIGGQNDSELEEKFDLAQKILSFELEPADNDRNQAIDR